MRPSRPRLRIRRIPSRPTATPETPFIGLTGGIGAGKSEALRALDRLGAATLSTDAVTHELLAAEDVRDLLVAELGSDVAPDGQIDRGAVASRVFGDDEKRKWLESVIWPRVGQRVAEFREKADDRPAAVVEVPLLFESGMENVFDKTVVVIADEDVRADRAAARGHELVEARAARQLTQEEKAQKADFVVRNDGTVEELEIKLSELLEKLREDGNS
ncbi:MAG TPA: dephospho-CoA kinase [Thermoleophilaceae bacterium]|nr:dephospho-CoA kinase [Thermoleophilaceae bacterium]